MQIWHFFISRDRMLISRFSYIEIYVKSRVKFKEGTLHYKCTAHTHTHTHTKVFGVLPLQRHPSPLSGSIWFFIVFSILSLIFFLITVFTNIFFLSYHCFTYIFLFTVLLELIFFTFQHSLGYF